MPLATLSYIRLSVIVFNPACWFYLALYFGAAAVYWWLKSRRLHRCIDVGTFITWVIGDHSRITPGSLPCGSLIALDMHALLSERGKKKKRKKKKQRQVGPKRKGTKPRGFCTTVTSADQTQSPVPTNPCRDASINHYYGF